MASSFWRRILNRKFQMNKILWCYNYNTDLTWLDRARINILFLHITPKRLVKSLFSRAVPFLSTLKLKQLTHITAYISNPRETFLIRLYGFLNIPYLLLLKPMHIYKYLYIKMYVKICRKDHSNLCRESKLFLDVF